MRIISLYKEAYSGIPRPIWLLSVTTFINRVGTLVLVFLSLYTTSALGFTPSQAGFLLTGYGIGSILGTFGGGWLSDRLNPIWIQVGSLFATSFLLVFLEFLKGFNTLLAYMMLLGMVQESLRPAVSAAIAGLCPDHIMNRAYGLNRLFINLGTSIGPALGGYLVLFGYHWAFRLDAITCFLAGWVLIWFFRGKMPNKQEEIEPETKIAVKPHHNPQFMFFLAAMLIYSVIIFQFFGSYPLYLRDFYNFSPSQFGNIMAGNGLIIIVFEMIIIKSLEAYRPLILTGIGMLLTGMGFGFLPFGSEVLWAYGLMVLWTVGEILVSPTSASFVAKIAPKNGRGAYFGWYTSIFSLALLIGPGLGTWIYDNKSPDTVWHIFGSLGTFAGVGMLFLAWLRRPKYSLT